MTPAEIRFAADGMLQSLGTWLRLMGYDCIMARTEADASATESGAATTDSRTKGVSFGGVSRAGRRLLEQALAEGRVFLSRNAHLSANLPRAMLERAQIVYVVAEHLPAQLREVVERFSLERERFVFSRCVECNKPLERVGKAEAAGQVPADVLERENDFWRCAHCGKTFWRGSHVHNSLKRLERWLTLSPQES